MPCRQQLLFLMLAGLLPSCFASKPAGRFVVRREDPKATYQGLLASFGNQLPDDTLINLMLPPTPLDRQLCRYPPTLLPDRLKKDKERKRTVYQQASNFTNTIALAVASGGCSTETKARVMLDLQNTLSKQIRIMIVYETSPLHPNWFLSLAPDNDVVSPDFDNLAILYFPYIHTEMLLSRLYGDYSHTLPGDAFLLSPANEKWSFHHTIEGSWQPIDVDEALNNKGISEYEFDGQDDLYWIRYVLFSLLILSPCFRAAYLFYAGGGRIRFRRDEQGHVVGFQYIPPMPYWLSQGRPPQQHEPVSEALTEEQFENLPEIIFVPVPEEDDDDDPVGVAEAIETDAEEEDDDEDEEVVEVGAERRDDPELGKGGSVQDPSITSIKTSQASSSQAASVSVGESKTPGIIVDTCPVEPVPAPSTSDESISCPADSGAVAASPPARAPATMSCRCRCTECSICIDDFEPGERLIVLPRCQHAFHKDCIKPWLLERQGRCPLCKTSVLQDENHHETDSDQSASSLNESSS